MPRSTSTSADVSDARNELAGRLRELRRAAGLTGQQLAQVLSWQPSKVSKIEHAKQTPSDDDIRTWCRAASAEQDTESLIAALHTLESRHAEWRRLLRGGLASFQDHHARDEEPGTIFRGFCPVYVPGLLQTPEYARARFIESAHQFGHRQDIDSAVAARMRRQEILTRPGKKFRIVITEATLSYTLCSPEVMLGQIGKLISFSMLPNVRLGVIPFDTFCAVAPQHGFWLRDEDLVTVETFSAELNLAQPPEIELYTKVFETLALAASYERKARTLLNDALETVADRLRASEQS
ncbi:helix-turn-helix transcriptional regulator [Promicromonospora sp. NPDC023987]|uniref:helix-turn-helix domain-containing protein n=1 Tax=Promicromonospora sp. NPDC023987 TaxID=3155360 RepID=UPI0033F347BC